MSYCEFGRSNRSNQLILLTKPTGFVNGPRLMTIDETGRFRQRVYSHRSV